jgi:ferrochelatase
LREFLQDPRVIELPRWKWWFILNFLILPRRSHESAAKYARIWDANNGSPLLHLTVLQAAKLSQALPDTFDVRFGMRYGNPSIQSALQEFNRRDIDRIVVLPMYPQYSAASTASACDALFGFLSKKRAMPAIRVVPPFYRDRGYVRSQTTIAHEVLGKLDRLPQKYIFSFHGYPVDFVKKGDPYQQHVLETARLMADEMRLAPDQWQVAYQSRFQKQVWLEPFTENLLCQLARQGTQRVFVMSPGFTTDCLETIDEIGREAAEAFRHAGGESLIRCPCLNDHPTWIEAMKNLVLQESAGWSSGESAHDRASWDRTKVVDDDSTVLDMDRTEHKA